SLIRLTFFTQPDFFAQVRWVFRGVEAADGGMVDIEIPGLAGAKLQHTFLGLDGYESQPLADVPAGFSAVVSSQRWSAASAPTKERGLAALAEVEDPTRRNTDTLQCVTCHVTTPLRGVRPELPAGYTSGYSLSTDGGESVSSLRSLRAFGWFMAQPMISQRVVNESAQVLAELAACP
ncbi:MAG: hypothetical protein JNK82_14135, partial [Myxococcaceae bacterium]|nr:hypothetical protein [Myxococcaceae bacterium]